MRLTRGSTLAGGCLFCPRAATAVWVGEGGDVRVCPACAVDVLPSLLADAVSLPTASPVPAADRAWQAAEAVYFRAVACRVAHDARTAARPRVHPEVS